MLLYEKEVVLTKCSSLNQTEHQDLPQTQQEQEVSKSSVTLALDFWADKENYNIHLRDVPHIFWNTHNVNNNLGGSALRSFFFFFKSHDRKCTNTILRKNQKHVNASRARAGRHSACQSHACVLVFNR